MAVTGMLAVTVLAALALGASAATNNVTLAPGLTLQWTVMTGGIVHFRTIYQGQAWVAVGVSVDGSMVPTNEPLSNAVIYQPETHIVQQYVLTGFDVTTILPSPTPKTCYGMTGQILPAQNLTIMDWYRAFDNGNVSMAQMNTNGVTNVIFAVGSNTTWSDNPNIMSNQALKLGSSSLPHKASEVLAPGLTLAWAAQNASVSFTVTFEGQAWVGLGISAGGEMRSWPQANAVVCWPQIHMVQQFQINGFDVSDFVETPSPSTVNNFACVQNSSTTVLSFTRAFDNGIKGQAQIRPNDQTHIIFAVGSNNTWGTPDFTRMGRTQIAFPSD